MSRYVDLEGVTWDGKSISSKIQEVQTKHGYIMQGITIGWLWGDNVPHIDLEEHDNHIIEQYKENTNLKDTIKEIHDNVANEMYCKAIDDFVHECDKHCGFYNGKNKSITREDILKIAEQLKERE